MIDKKDWKKVKFGDVVRLSKARSSDPLADGYDRYIGLDHIEPEDLRIRRWGNVADGVTFTSVFKPGQVLFGKRRAYQRKVAVADFSGVCSGDIYVFESKDSKVLLPELLPFICQAEAFFQHAVGTSAGSLSPRTNWTSLADFLFNLPPLEEQQKLSECLIAMEGNTKALRNALGALSQLQVSVVNATFIKESSVTSAEITADQLHAGWKLFCAEDLCSAPITKGATPSASVSLEDTGIPFIKVYNLTFDGSIDLSIDPSFISNAAHSKELARSTVLPGDILMNIVGPPLGKVSVIPKSFPEANINQAIARFRLKDPRFISLVCSYLLSDLAQQWLLSRSKKTSGQRNLTLELCQSLPVPVPPDNLLKEITKRFDALSDCRIALERRLSAAIQVKNEYCNLVLQ